MVITEFVHHFGHEVRPFFSYHGDPQKVIAELPQQGQIIFRFLLLLIPGLILFP